MGADRLMATISRCVGIFGEEWDALLDGVIRNGEPLVPLLASESPLRPKRPLLLSIPEATLLLYDLQNRASETRVVEVIFQRVDRETATLLWSRVLGEYPPVRKHHFLRAIARVTEYEANHLAQSARVHGIGAVVKGALDDTLPRAHELIPGQHFTPAIYRRWVNWYLPFKRTAYEIIVGQRAFIHSTPDGEWVFRRSGERWPIPPPTEGLRACEEVIAEVEEREGRLVIVDTLHASDDVQRWQRPYIERNTNARLLRDNDHLLSLIRNLDRGTTLRLIDADAPYYDGGGYGGYIAPDSLFELPLLLTRARLLDGEAEVCLSVMDGFDAEQVTCVKCDAEILLVPRLREHLTTRWTETESLGVVLVCLAFGYEDERLDSPNVIRIDGSLGISDVIQKGDLLAISNA